MYQDLIVEEIRQYRNSHAKKYNYDLDAIFEDLKKSEQASSQKIVNFAPKRIITKIEMDDFAESSEMTQTELEAISK